MKPDVPDEVFNKVIEYLLNTPQALAAVILSSLSGHLWAYIVLTYFRSSEKGEKFLDGHFGKLSLGIMYHALIMLPIYLLSNHSFHIEYEKLIAAIIPTFLYGLALQICIFAGITLIKRG